MKFAGMLKDARKQNNFSQKFLADRLGLKPPTISKYENGIAFPSPDVLKGLCDLFKWDLIEIFQKVYSEKVPDTVQPLMGRLKMREESDTESGDAGTDVDPAVMDFLKDPKMPNPTETELEVITAIKLKGMKPTKWFYKSLIEDLRNEGLVKREESSGAGSLVSEGA